MSVERWVTRSAEELWRRAGSSGAYPRDAEELALFGLRASPVALPGLTLCAASDWLRARGCMLPAGRDRELHGLLYSHRGAAVVFFDPRDGEPERRYTLAHECAHLWIEVLEPRERAIAALGQAVAAALDGQRPPTPQEHAYCLVHRLSLEPVAHLLARDGVLGLVDGGVLSAERRADTLALELLAPEAEALDRLPDPSPWNEWLAQASRCLEQEFGLPPTTARAYARRLGPQIGAAPSFLERLTGPR